MNREIKFRVWDGKKYLHNDTFCLFPDDEDGFEVRLIVPYGILEACPNAVVQQWTGLKDKNEKMIFEGDILRQNDLRFEIRFESFQWVAVCPYYNKYHHPRIEHFRLCVSGEVVGNIMENPELLKA